MPDINSILRGLDRRLKGIYTAAYQQAIKNQEKAIEKLAAFDAAKFPNATADELRKARQNYTWQVQRTTGIADSIAKEIAQSGQTAAKMIEGARLGIYRESYKGALYSIDRQLGYRVSWSIYDMNQLAALLGESERAPFTQIAYRRLGSDTRIVRRLQNELSQAVILGEGIPKINRRIRDVARMSHRHAQRIARTETLRVANQGRMLGFYQARDNYGIQMRKKWIATNDERTRPDHARMDGEVVDLDEVFSNGLMQPGDPLGPPEQVINCRCAVVAVVKWVGSGSALEKSGNDGIINFGGERMNILPNAENAIIPIEKLIDYSLNPDREPNKAMAFQKALGYNQSNADSLAENILSNLTHFDAVEKTDNGYGKRYDVLMRLIGANERAANVKTAWIVDRETRQTRLISTYVTKKRVKE